VTVYSFYLQIIFPFSDCQPWRWEIVLFQNTGLILTVEKIKLPKKDLNLHKQYSEYFISPRLKVHHCVHKVQHLLLSWGSCSQYSSTLFWKALNICSSLHITSQVSYPYKIAGKTSFLCFNIYGFSGRGKAINFWIEW